MPYYICFEHPILDNEESYYTQYLSKSYDNIVLNIDNKSKIYLFKERSSYLKDIKKHYAGASIHDIYPILRVNILRDTIFLDNGQTIPIQQISSIQAIEFIYTNGMIKSPGVSFFSSVDLEKLMDPFKKQIEIETAPQKIEELKRSIHTLCLTPRYEHTAMGVNIERLISTLETVDNLVIRKNILFAVDALMKKVNQRRCRHAVDIQSSIEYSHLKCLASGNRDREGRVRVRGSASAELMLLGFLIAASGIFISIMYTYTVKIAAPVGIVGLGLFAYGSRTSGAARAIENVMKELVHVNTAIENARVSTLPIRSTPTTPVNVPSFGFSTP